MTGELAMTMEQSHPSVWSEAAWRNELDEMRLAACTLPWLGNMGFNYQMAMVRLFELLQEWPEFHIRATYGQGWVEITVTAQGYTAMVHLSNRAEKWRVSGATWRYIGMYPDRRLRKWLEAFEQFREERIAVHAAYENAIGRIYGKKDSLSPFTEEGD